ncbi:MAG: hypothetical protein ACPG66_09910, partial [Flavobacteriales bacterium]
MLSREDKAAGNGAIYAPAGLASAIRRQATRNAQVYAFYASRGRVDTSAVANFSFTKRNADQFPKIRELIALVLNEVDHSKILARLIRGQVVPTDAKSWASLVKQNKIKESRIMLSVLTITKSQRRKAPVSPVVPAPSSPSGEGAQPSASASLDRKELLETTNRSYMDDGAVEMLMNNCRELLFAVVLTTAHGMIEPELAGMVKQFDRNKVDEDKLAALHSDGCIIKRSLDKLEIHLNVNSPRVHDFLSGVETNRDVANGQPHLWKRKHQSIYVFSEHLLLHFWHCKKCGAERTEQMKTNILVGHLDMNHREFLAKEVYNEEKHIHSFTFEQTIEKLMSFESRQQRLEEWNDERPPENASGLSSPPFQVASFAASGVPPGPPHQRSSRPQQQPRRHQRTSSSQSAGQNRMPVTKLLQEAKRLTKSPDHLHMFKFMLNVQQRNPDARDFFNKWIFKLMTNFNRFKTQGCDNCSSALVPHILCPGCHPVLSGKPGEQTVIDHLKSKGHNHGGTKQRRPRPGGNRGPQRNQRQRANHTIAAHSGQGSVHDLSGAVNFEPTNVSLHTSLFNLSVATGHWPHESTQLLSPGLSRWEARRSAKTEQALACAGLTVKAVPSVLDMVFDRAPASVKVASVIAGFDEASPSHAPKRKNNSGHTPSPRPSKRPSHTFERGVSTSTSVSLGSTASGVVANVTGHKHLLGALTSPQSSLTPPMNAPQCAHAPHCDERACRPEQGSLCRLCVHPEDGTLPCDGCMRFDPDFGLCEAKHLFTRVSHVALVTSGSFFSTNVNKGDTPTSKTSVVWVLDSGASGMFTNDATILTNKQPTDSRVSGSNATSKPMRVTHVGRYGIFPVVLLVPSISSNLMSVSILRKLGFHVDFMALRVSRGPIVWDFKHDKERDL